mgnify:FL=1
MNDLLFFLAMIGVWYFVQAWLLPRFGVRT